AVGPASTSNLQVIDLCRIPEDDRESLALDRANEEARRPFDLASGPLFRSTLIRIGELDHVLLLNMHHIVSDAWSRGVLANELSDLYDAYSEKRQSVLSELPLQYSDFAAWQREWLQGEVLESQLNYWKDHLNGKIDLLDLPTDRPRPPLQTFRGASEAIMLP